MQRGIPWLVLAVLVAGAALRFYGLAEPGYRNNEDYAVLGAQAILEEGVPRLPSGVIYPRALPLSYGVAAVFVSAGQSEFTARIIPVVLSVLSLLIVYCLGRRAFDPQVGLTAALILAFSVWELLVAQTARMYGPLAFFYLLSVYLACRVGCDDRRRLGVALFFSAALTSLLHPMGVMLLLPLLVLLVPGTGNVQNKRWLAAGIFAVLLGYFGTAMFEQHHYDAWNVLVTENFPEAAAGAPRPSLLTVINERYLALARAAAEWSGIASPSGVVFAAAVLALGAAGATRRFAGISSWRFFVALALIVFFAALQQLMLAGYCLAAYLLLAGRIGEERYPQRGFALAGLIGALGVGWILASGFLAPDMSLTKTVRTVAGYPPNFLELLARPQPLLFLFMLVSVAATVFTWLQRRDNGFAAMYVSAALILPATALGAHPTALYRFFERYAFFLHALFVLLAAHGIWVLVRFVQGRFGQGNSGWVTRPASAWLAVAGLLLLTGAVQPAASLRTVNADYGANSLGRYHRVFFPDHAGPSQYVCQHAGPGDVVVAMDVLAHHAYCARTDYHFSRDFKGDAEGWIGRRTLFEVGQFESVLAAASGRVWVVLAAQPIRRMRDDAEMQEFLQYLSDDCFKRAFPGRDGLSDVYFYNAGCQPGDRSRSQGG